MSAARPNVTHRRLPRLLLAAGVLLVALVPLLTPNTYIHNMLIMAFVLAILASGWNVMAGFTGYVSLGHAAFIGVGAYTGGILAARWEVSPLLVAPLGGVAAALVAFVLGLVTRRTRGAAFVIVSFAMLELLNIITRNWTSLTNGSNGFLMPLPTWDVRFQNWPFYYALLFLLLLSIVMTAAIRRSKLGLGLMAIRDDEVKAEGIGVVTSVYKSIAFMASAVVIGMAGTVYGYYVSFLDTGAMFDIALSMEVVLAALLGGRGTVWGPVLGAFLLQPLSQFTNTTIGGAHAGAFRLVLFGGLIVVVALLLPRGILPGVQDLLRRRRAVSPTGARLADSDVPAAPSSPRLAALSRGGGALLRIRGVSKRFGGVTALDQATFDVPQGSITALIGPNGSGKTTLFNIADGTYTATAGTVEFGGKDVTRLRRSRRALLGIGRTYQLPRLFNSLTVLENVAAATGEFRFSRLARSAVSGAEAARATELLTFVGMGEYVTTRAKDLSYGQRKLVELAQVLMLDPAVILLDEPAAGINPTLVKRLATLIRALNRSGRTFVIVEHDMQFVLSLSDPVVALARGRVIADGTPAEVCNDPAVLSAYLGDDFVLESDPIGSVR